MKQGLMALLLMSVMGVANATWYTGTVSRLGVAYDGSTITLRIAGFTRTDCTCYAAWNTDMCLDRTRVSFREEYASILRARATGQTIQVNIDDSTCKVIAVYELDPGA